MTPIPEMLALALRHHQAGNLQQAEQLYRRILQADPNHAESHHSLGVLALQRANYNLAITTIRQAISLNPGAATYYCNLGVAYQAVGQAEQAAASYQQAIRLQPAFAEAHYNLGNVLRNQGKLEEAVVHCRQALRLRPSFFQAHDSLGNALLDQGKVEEAMAHHQEALRIRPDYAEAHNGLGNALFSQGKFEEAVTCHQQALRIRPDYADAHSNLALALQALGKLAEAVAHFREAIRLKPSYAVLHHNLACAFLEQGRLDVALASFEQALSLQPDFAAAQSNRLFCLNYDPQADPDFVFAEHCRWGQAQESRQSDVGSPMSEELVLTSDIRLPTSDVPERPLRIGYVSPDLRFHPLTRYLEGVLAHHDPRQVEVFCYAEVLRPDAVTKRLQNLVQGWRWTCRLTDTQVAERIRSDRIDILVDLAGHTGNNRLRVFAHKPAPVQAAWLGYLNTTGLTAVDYRLTDDVLDAPGQPVRDTEELMRLPNGMCCFAPPPDAPGVAPLPALRRGRLTFGSLHGLLKLNARVLDLWGRVLKAVPTARLLLFHDDLVPTAQEPIRRQFMERGIASERLDLRQGSSAPGYLGVYEEIDVSLDTFPCTGGVTTCESLWMGAPVLSLYGVRPAGRHSASLLARVGLSDWVVQTPEQYVALAAGLAEDLDRLAQLRTMLRDRMATTLCDARRFTRELEDAYRTMWRRWCGKPSF